jgi:hypothetical protein
METWSPVTSMTSVTRVLLSASAKSADDCMGIYSTYIALQSLLYPPVIQTWRQPCMDPMKSASLTKHIRLAVLISMVEFVGLVKPCQRCQAGQSGHHTGRSHHLGSPIPSHAQPIQQFQAGQYQQFGAHYHPYFALLCLTMPD